MGDGASTNPRQISQAANQILWELKSKLRSLPGRRWQGGAWQDVSQIISPVLALACARAGGHPLLQGSELGPQARNGLHTRANGSQCSHSLCEAKGVAGQLIGRGLQTPDEQQGDQGHEQRCQEQPQVRGGKFHRGMPGHGTACHDMP